jgi:hypothetical protein
MNLDVNLIYHNYITRLIIFSLFLYQNRIKKQDEYINSVKEFIKKRCPWKIKLKITYKVLPRQEERKLYLKKILLDDDTDYLKKIAVEYETPYKKVKIIVDLSDKDRYENYLYL